MREKPTTTPLAVTILVISFLCPTELSLYVEGLRLPPHRLALLALLPLALWRLLTSPALKIRAFDLAFIAYNAWSIAVFIHHLGFSEGIEFGGSLAVEALGAYLVARVWIRNVETFEATLRTMMLAIMVSAAFALPEALLGQTFVHDTLANLTGYIHPTAVETRLGLTRAYSLFDHPIHYGTFCAALLALVWFTARSRTELRNRVALICGATVLGLSSAPLLCIFLQAAMLSWERLTRGIKGRTALTLGVLLALYVVASLVMSRSPINLIATTMTLDSWTGFYRLQIWEHGLSSVADNPWTGIGLEDWSRPAWMVSPTIDAFWLVIAMRQGLPAVLLIALAFALLMRRVVVSGLRNRDRHIRQLARGWIMTMIALSLIGTTVHFWNVLYAFFFFVAGLGAWLADPIRQRSRASRTTPIAGRTYAQDVYNPQPMPVGA